MTIIISPKVPKELIKKLAALHAENVEQFEASITALAPLYYPIRVGEGAADDAKNAIDSLRALILEKSAKAADAVRDQRALDFATALNELADIELFVKDGKKYNSVGTVFIWLKDRLDPAFEEQMTPTITRVQKEDGSFSYLFSVVAQKQRGRAGANSGGRFRPDIITLIDGTPVMGAATDILRSPAYQGTKAGKDWEMVEKGIAKGARSAIFLGLANDAQKSGEHELPIFRVWVLKRDDEGNLVNENGNFVAIELDANGSQYIENLADNKAKFNNAALKSVREKHPQPIWTKELLDSIAKKQQQPAAPAPAPVPVAAPVMQQAPVPVAPVAPVPIAPMPVANIPPLPVAARAARGRRGGPVPVTPGGPVPFNPPQSR